MIEKIKKEIQRQLQESEERLSHINARGFVAPNEEQLIVHLKGLLSFIDTHKIKEVDLEKELDKEWNKCEPVDEGMGLEIASIEHEQFDNIAKHFFELGLNASNPITEVNLESRVRQVIDLYLEAGEHYNSVIKDERKEYGGSDLVIKLLNGIIDAKELGIQYVLDKLKAQKVE